MTLLERRDALHNLMRETLKPEKQALLLHDAISAFMGAQEYCEFIRDEYVLIYDEIEENNLITLASCCD